MRRKLIIKIILIVSISLVSLFCLGILLFLFTGYETFKNFDPIPPDFTFSIKESKNDGVFLFFYQPEKEIYIFKEYKIAVKEAWLEKFNEDQISNRKYRSNFKLIITFNNIEQEKSINFSNLEWELDSNKRCARIGNLLEEGNLLFRFDIFPKYDSVMLNVFDGGNSLQNREYLGKIKLLKSK